jgi:DNA-binding response OmpR family regulator
MTKTDQVDLGIDFEARTVSRSGQVIELTPTEFDLLEILFRNRGTVVSRAAIWKHLYCELPDYTSNVIDVYVRYLRKKIDTNSTNPLIITCRGSGYMLRQEPNPRSNS